MSGAGHGALCSFQLFALPWRRVCFNLNNLFNGSSSVNVNTVSRGIVNYYENVEDTPPRALYTLKIVNWAVLYASLILATLLWCTIFIIYRILRVGGVTAGMRVYHRVIEMLVESAALYSAVLVIILVLDVRNELAGGYVEEVAIAIRVRLTFFNFVVTTACLLGNCAYNFGRPRCSRTCAPRRLLERKYQGIVSSIRKSFKFTK